MILKFKKKSPTGRRLTDGYKCLKKKNTNAISYISYKPLIKITPNLTMFIQESVGQHFYIVGE